MPDPTEPRRFPPPWHVDEAIEGFQALAFVYCLLASSLPAWRRPSAMHFATVALSVGVYELLARRRRRTRNSPVSTASISRKYLSGSVTQSCLSADWPCCCQSATTSR